MKKITKFLIGTIGLCLLSPLIAFASPVQVDRLIDHIEPLVKSDYIKARYFVASSTNASTFPYASTTMITATTASTSNLLISGIPANRSLYTTTGGQVTSSSLYTFDGSTYTFNTGNDTGSISWNFKGDNGAISALTMSGAGDIFSLGSSGSTANIGSASAGGSRLNVTCNNPSKNGFAIYSSLGFIQHEMDCLGNYVAQAGITSATLNTSGAGVIGTTLNVGTNLTVNGTSLVKGAETVYGLVTAPRFTATTSVASIFPYASTTAVSVSNALYVGSTNQFSVASNGITSINGTALSNTKLMTISTTEHSSANFNDFSVVDSAGGEVFGAAAWNGGGGAAGYGANVVSSNCAGAACRLGEIGGKNTNNTFRLGDFIFQTGTAKDIGEIVTLLGKGSGGFAYAQYEAMLDTANTGTSFNSASVPKYNIDVLGNGRFTSLVDAANFVATSTTATSTLTNVYIANTGTSTPYIYSKTAGRGGTIIMEDEGGGACTIITTKAGAIKNAVVTCPTEI